MQLSTEEERMAIRDEHDRVQALDLTQANVEVESLRIQLATVQEYLDAPGIVQAMATREILRRQITELAQHIFKLENERDGTERADSRRVAGLLKRLELTRNERGMTDGRPGRSWSCYQSGRDVRFLSPGKSDPEGLAILLAGLDAEGFKYTNSDGHITVQRQPVKS